jgi:hypothetical protein
VRARRSPDRDASDQCSRGADRFLGGEEAATFVCESDPQTQGVRTPPAKTDGRELPSELAPWTLLDEQVRLEAPSAMSDERDEFALEAIPVALGVAVLVSAQAAV